MPAKVLVAGGVGVVAFFAWPAIVSSSAATAATSFVSSVGTTVVTTATSATTSLAASSTGVALQAAATKIAATSAGVAIKSVAAGGLAKAGALTTSAGVVKMIDHLKEQQPMMQRTFVATAIAQSSFLKINAADNFLHPNDEQIISNLEAEEEATLAGL